jgi:fructose-1,6-bisphosphatase/inositol monophosphatase family enzyme
MIRPPEHALRLLPVVVDLQRTIRDAVLEASRRSSLEELSEVADDAPGDTIYAVDKVSEALLVEAFEREAGAAGGVVLVAEGIHGGSLVLPEGTSESNARLRVIVDPIDGTRGIMYQKRSAWVLTGIAENRGPATRLSDVVCAVQTEIPTLKQYLADELWAVRGQGMQALRANVLTGERTTLSLRPSRAGSLEHGYAMICRFFPGARDVLAEIDEEIVRAVLGPPRPGKALCFEDQYASTGGQFYELAAGHDRFNADLRPLLRGVLESRGEPAGLCCHPYDVGAALIASEAGVLLTNPDGSAFDCKLDVDSDVAWVGYANAELRARIEPVLQRVLRRRGLLP